MYNSKWAYYCAIISAVEQLSSKMLEIYSTALIDHLIMGYQFPNGPLASAGKTNLTNHNMCKNQKICQSSIPVQ